MDSATGSRFGSWLLAVGGWQLAVSSYWQSVSAGRGALATGGRIVEGLDLLGDGEASEGAETLRPLGKNGWTCGIGAVSCRTTAGDRQSRQLNPPKAPRTLDARSKAMEMQASRRLLTPSQSHYGGEAGLPIGGSRGNRPRRFPQDACTLAGNIGSHVITFVGRYYVGTKRPYGYELLLENRQTGSQRPPNVI